MKFGANSMSLKTTRISFKMKQKYDVLVGHSDH